jgi:ATP-binding cassette subfamily C (CFTR/MRP) protein 1
MELTNPLHHSGTFLIEGTIRENAHPWQDTVSDQTIIEVLGQVGLWDKVKSLGGLDATLDENLLSHGQRQHFCLAKALLRRNSIVILDELTSQ